MNNTRIMAIIMMIPLFCLGISGCGSQNNASPGTLDTEVQDAPGKEEQPPQKEEDDPYNAEAESETAASSEIVTIPALMPELPDLSAEENYNESEAYYDWQSSYFKLIEKSFDAQEGMDAFYSSVISELIGSGNPSPDENAVCSPLNLYIALAMLAETADKGTRAQILDTIRADSLDALRENIDALWNANHVSTPALESLLANSLWLRDGTEYNRDTLETLAEKYHASSYSGPMGTGKMDEMLQNWVDENTGHLLEEYTKGLHTTPDTVLALISTLYYKAAWYDKFQDAFTVKELFHAPSGDVEVEMMHRSDDMGVFIRDRFSAISLGLNDSGSMFFFLPDEGTKLQDVINDPETLNIVRRKSNASDFAHVNMSIPKFKVQSDIDLIESLKRLGITDAFDPGRSDFTPLTTDTNGPVYVNKAEHAATLEIDEDGVTGAAYTAILLAEGAALMDGQEYDFILDRPFYFVVTARDGSVLFAGTVVEP